MSGENRTARPPGGGPEDGIVPQGGPSRRSLLRGAAGFAGAGLAASAVTGAIAGPALAAARPADSAGTGDPGPASGVVVHVRDTRTGEMDIFSGTSQVRLRDPHLAGRLAQAVR
jgi:hypothetical protein